MIKFHNYIIFYKSLNEKKKFITNKIDSKVKDEESEIVTNVTEIKN